MCFTSREGATQHSETIQTFTPLRRGVCLSQAAQVSATQPGHFHTSLVNTSEPDVCCCCGLPPMSQGAGETAQTRQTRNSLPQLTQRPDRPI